jgi:hypothetical protein
LDPEITELINGYQIDWGEPSHLKAKVTRLHLSSDGQVKGQLEIRYNLNGSESYLLVPTQFNFSTESTREKHAKQLSAKLDLKIEWREIFDFLCQKIQELARGGEPVIELVTGSEIKPPEYMLYPLIVKNYPNVIFGDPSAAKSTIAVILSQVVMLPWHDNPMGLTAPKNSTRVLYLDWEADAETIQWQTTMLQRGIEHAKVLHLHYRHCSQPLANDLDEIKWHLGATKATMVVIDSQGLAAGGELKDTQPAISFYAGLRALKVTSLILAHNSKDKESKTRSIYGNQYFTAQARNVWEARKNQEVGSKEMDIALFHRKPPPFAGVHNPIGFKIIFDDDGGKMNIASSDPRTVGEFLDQMSLKSRIIETLKSGKLSTKELADTLDESTNQVKARCNDLKHRGQLRKFEDKWGLSSYDY